MQGRSGELELVTVSAVALILTQVDVGKFVPGGDADAVVPPIVQAAMGADELAVGKAAPVPGIASQQQPYAWFAMGSGGERELAGPWAAKERVQRNPGLGGGTGVSRGQGTQAAALAPARECDEREGLGTWNSLRDQTSRQGRRPSWQTN